MVHSLHPEWLKHSLEITLARLNISTLDCVYLSEPIEHLMLKYADKKEMKMRLAHAFAFLEEMVQDGKIKAYGI
jgi:aryl-alcohol dehydrogenase-like predicted oxidoreductase